jgi:ketosteroid isomerase-like protein
MCLEGAVLHMGSDRAVLLPQIALCDRDGVELRVVGTKPALTSCLCTAFSASLGAALLVLVQTESVPGARRECREAGRSSSRGIARPHATWASIDEHRRGDPGAAAFGVLNLGDAFALTRVGRCSRDRCGRNVDDLDGSEEATMGETENRMILDRLYDRVWIGETHDFDVMDEVFADDAVVEYPQSRERMRGRANIRAAEENYPGLPKVTIRRKLVVGDLALVESDLDYQGRSYQEVSIFEFRDGKIVRLTQYFPEPFEAAESRARWVERM